MDTSLTTMRDREDEPFHLVPVVSSGDGNSQRETHCLVCRDRFAE